MWNYEKNELYGFTYYEVSLKRYGGKSLAQMGQNNPQQNKDQILSFVTGM